MWFGKSREERGVDMKGQGRTGPSASLQRALLQASSTYSTQVLPVAQVSQDDCKLVTA